MKRIPEPELMDDPEQARAYAMADFSEPHQAFIERFRERFPDHSPLRVLDLGCGPADISIRFAHAYPNCELTGIDGSEAMLALGREAVDAADMQDRIRLVRVRLPGELPAHSTFDTVISNSLLHHLADPLVLWNTLKDNGPPQRRSIFVMDLLRPDSRSVARRLVDAYSGNEPELLKRDFLKSLLASYRPDEIRAQLLTAGLEGYLQIDVVSDRHLIVWGNLA